MTPPRDRDRRRQPRDLPTGVRRRQRHRRRQRARHKRTFLGVGIGGFVVLIVILVAAGFGGAAAFRSSCSLSSLRAVAIGQNSFVYASDGRLLGSIPAERNRQPVPLRHVSSWMRKATVAIEDRRFYEHGGVDYEGIARALWKDLRAGRVVEGGSTITQQLVRNLYISKEVTLKRKIKEACLAIKLSRAWSKDRILASYMNQVYYGNHAYGIEAASQTYFSRHAQSLSLPQAALLAGLPQAPSIYDPFERPGQATARRDQVLRAMLQNGDISRREYTLAVATPLRLKAGRLYTRIREPYFFSYVRDELISQYGANTVRTGGLRVYTTINLRFQRAAEKAIRDTLYLKTDPAAAIVSINPANGAIRAMTAVTSRKKNQFNLVAQARRQPGSTFKTIVLTAAISEGMNPNSTYYVSAPFHYQPDPYTLCPTGCWDVATYDHTYAGGISVAGATLRSDNTVFAQLTLDVGPKKVAEMAHKLGVRSPLDVVPSMGLGADAVSPLDMASVYTTIAAGGIYSRPMAIRRVVLANGKEDTDAGWGRPERQRVISDGVAYEVTRILEQNILHGTGVGAYFGRTSAGKTGTTDNHADAWFCGFTPTLSATVWVGYPAGEIPMENVHGISVAGGTFPATIWHLFMQSAIGSAPPVNWKLPKHYVVWKPFKRGQYALRYVPTPYKPEKTTSGKTTTKKVTTTTRETTPAQTEPPPIVPKPPPPTTTAEPPPPVTTEPPPPPPPPDD